MTGCAFYPGGQVGRGVAPLLCIIIVIIVIIIIIMVSSTEVPPARQDHPDGEAGR